ncbi:hypothetical protein F4861DRAFT_490419 [Xylaria intraflava]|nr:hypothetical protein F4861DRAFT_490419 [Xylaria intraflava]
MPSLAQPERSMVSPSSRKRRREDGEEVQTPFGSTLEASQNPLSTINDNDRLILPSSRATPSAFGLPGKPIALPSTKKFRRLDDNDHEQPDNNGHDHHVLTSAALPQSQFPHAHPDPNSTAASSQQVLVNVTRTTPSHPLLSPCHICHRKPTKKSDLDSYSNCTGCGERTCFICLRACQGWLPRPEEGKTDQPAPEEEETCVSFVMEDVDDQESAHDHADGYIHFKKTQQRQKKGEGGGAGSWNGHGHREVICSRCCIERGSEGEVVCLGCLAGIEGA